jgi:PAS domain S-box-containing protein
VAGALDRARGTEERFRAYVEQAADALFVHDFQGRFIDVNRQACASLGYTRDELLGMSVFDVECDFDLERAQAAWREIRPGEPFTLAGTQRRKDGSTFPVEVRFGCFDLGGERHFLGLVRDVSEREHTAAALRQSEARLRLALAAARVGTFDWDVERGRITWSSWHEALWGLEPGQFAGTYAAFAERVHPDDLVGVEARLEECIAERAPFNHEFRVVWPDASVHWIHATGEFEFDPGGRAARMRGAVVEITGRKRQEEVVRESERRLRGILDTLFVFVGLIDLEGRILEVNEAPLAAAGLTRADVIGRTVPDSFWYSYSPELQARVSAAVGRAARGEIVREDYLIRVAHGRKITIDTTFAPLRDAAGRVVQVVGSAMDVTERKQAERRLTELNRTYAMVSGVNALTVREREAQAILEGACRIAVDQGGFLMAWIGLSKSSTDPVELAAHAGASRDTLGVLGRIFADPAAGCAFTRHALETGRPTACNDVEHDPLAAPWRAAALERGYRSMIALPLRIGEERAGTFNLYADKVGFFDEQETRLLRDLAVDVGFALDVAGREAERRAAEDRDARQRNALVGLTSRRHEASDVASRLRDITEAAARTLGVARASVWRYGPNRTTIECADLFVAERGEHSSGVVLSAETHPAYFRALAEAEVIAADDAASDPRTHEFGDDYLGPLGIGAMLDAPIEVSGDRAGVLCHEHVGPPRDWTADEETFAVAMANLVALALEAAERRQAEAALRASEERFRELAENIQEVFWMTDPAKGKMLYVSPAYEAIWGRSRLSLYESPAAWLDSIHEDDRDRIRLAAAAQARGGYNEVYRIVRPDGGLRWIHDRGFPVVGEGGEVARIVGTAEDVTKQRQLEEQYRQSQKMEAIGRLAGGVAHDFNNILAAMMMQAELTLMEDDIPDDVRQSLGDIRADAQRAANLTRQLLLFSRREVMQPRNLDLNDLVTSLAKMLQRIIGEDVRLEIDLHEGPLLTYADPGMLDQVLMNLAVNARDAMPSGGSLLLETAERTIAAEEAAASTDASEGRHLCLSVTDTGCGIAPEHLSRVFEPFFTTKVAGSGTGLGLATVFGIVKQHGGWLEVDSQVDKGTTFRVFLPAVEASDTPHVVPDSVAVGGGSETILLVEDEAAVRTLTHVVLERSGYRVLPASSGVEAVAVWERSKGKVDLLFTDIVMPDQMSGRELAERLRTDDPGLRVLFTSGYSADIAGRALILQAGQNFIAKPASPQQILASVRRCLDSPRAR